MGKGMVEILSPWIFEEECVLAVTEALAVPSGCSSCSSSSAPSAISPRPSEGPFDNDNSDVAEKGGARRGSIVT